MESKKINPFEIKTTHITQAMLYLWVPLLMVLRVFISAESRPITYLIAILTMMVVFLSFFLSSFSSIKRDNENDA